MTMTQPPIPPETMFTVTLPAGAWLLVSTVMRQAPVAYDQMHPVMTAFNEQIDAAIADWRKESPTP
jgi:hypothetical protein